MRKIFLALLVPAIGCYAFPQNLKEMIHESTVITTAAVSSSGNTGHTRAIYINNVSINAVRHFKKTFKNVTDEKWYEMPDGYRVNFTIKDIRCRLDYDEDGKWLHSIKYYDEKKLPVEVRRLVVSSYLDYSIRTVEEIEAPHNILFYVIHLEGETNWINIKVSDYEINELEKIKKS